ncbi:MULTISPECIES: flagellin [unclassified Rhizobium]|uniref:flagellin N-terminal helical domain-containing protein n=1 Tax=unclassified Rhizobium TaxID=2613769 RepID=UPI0016031780|nr:MULTISPECIES: flagellin [unclassified Rhizobium]MBB1248758.1 flagellin [Rhizobium sp. G21]MCV3766247.1 flagellin [Rhizobium sp. TRM95796]
MTSIVTNIQAMAALDTLRSINAGMEETQGRVSSGYRVQDASDNAAYWSIATTMKSDNKALSTVQDALGFAAAKSDTAYTGLNSAIDVVTEIKAKLVAAREPGVDKEKINSELSELKNQLVSISQSASFSGQNWLYNNDTTVNSTVDMVGSFVRDSTGGVSVELITFDTADSTLIDNVDPTLGILTAANFTSYPTGTTTSTGAYYLIAIDSGNTQNGSVVELTNSTADYQIDNMISVVDDMLTQMTEAAAVIGSTNMRIDMQNEFVADLMDVIDKGVGRLVDADMNEESTKLKALQTQQQLGIQALSIANSNSENILSLFRN